MVVEMRYDGPRDSDGLRDSDVLKEQSMMKSADSRERVEILALLESVMAKIDGCHKRVYVHEERIQSILRPQDDGPGDVFPEIDNLSPVARDLMRCTRGLDALMMRIDMMTDRVEL